MIESIGLAIGYLNDRENIIKNNLYEIINKWICEFNDENK